MSNSEQPREVTVERKTLLECQKLEREIHVLSVPFWQRPAWVGAVATILGALTVWVSWTVDRKFAKAQADVDRAQAQLVEQKTQLDELKSETNEQRREKTRQEFEFRQERELISLRRDALVSQREVLEAANEQLGREKDRLSVEVGKSVEFKKAAQLVSDVGGAILSVNLGERVEYWAVFEDTSFFNLGDLSKDHLITDYPEALRDQKSNIDSALESLGGIPNLSSIMIDSSLFNFTAEGLESLELTTTLDTIHLRGSGFNDANIAFVFDLASVKSLTFSDCAITDRALQDIGAHSNLEELWISGGEITDRGLIPLAQLTNLKSLHLACPLITDNGLTFTSQLRELQHLSLALPELTSLGLQHVPGFDLQGLWIPRSDVGDDGLRRISQFTSLRHLLLVDQQSVTDVGIAELNKLTDLQTLVLSGSAITDVGVAKLAGMERIRWLDISGSGAVSDNGIRHLQPLRELRVFDASNTQVGDETIAMLENHSKLVELLLSGTQVSDVGLARVEKFKSLNHIQVYGTRVSVERCRELEQRLPSLQLEYDATQFPPVEATPKAPVLAAPAA